MNREEYWQIVNDSLESLRAATGQEWELENTGGGHTAFMLNLPNGYYMITNDAGAPVLEEWDDITLGWYATPYDYIDGVIVDTVTTLEQLKKWAGN